MNFMNDAMKAVGDNIFRELLNGCFNRPDFTPDACVVAIDNNLSLWENGKEEIQARARMVPSFVLNMASSYIAEIKAQYGGMTELTLEWLKTDQPVYYSIIMTTPGGVEWLDQQVNDILIGLKIIRE